MEGPQVFFGYESRPELTRESRNVALATIRSVVREASAAEEVLERPLAVSFLGPEVAEDRFVYPEVGRETKKVEVLSRKLADGKRVEPRLAIHPAYRPYLEISE